MSCQQIQDQLSAYLDGELPAEEARGVQRHLDECAACRDLLKELRAVAQLVSSLPRRRAPAELAEEFQSRLERRMLLSPMADQAASALQTDRAMARERPAVWPRVAAIAASVLLAVGITWLALAPRPAPTEQTAQPEPGGAARLEGERIVSADESGRRAEFLKGAPAERAALRDDAKDRSALAPAAKQVEELGADSRHQAQALKEREAADNAYPKSGTAAWAAQAKAKGPVVVSTENVLTLESHVERAQAETELKKLLHKLNLNLAPQTEATAQVAIVPPAKSVMAKRDVDKSLELYETTTYVGVASPSQVKQLAVDIAGSKVFRVRPEALGGTFAAADALRKAQPQAAEAALTEKKSSGPSEGRKPESNEAPAAMAARHVAAERTADYGREAPSAAPAAESPKSEQTPPAPSAPAGAVAKEGQRGGEATGPPEAAESAANAPRDSAEAGEQQLVIVIQLVAPRDAAAARAAALDAEAARAARAAAAPGQPDSNKSAPAQAESAKQ